MSKMVERKSGVLERTFDVLEPKSLDDWQSSGGQTLYLISSSKSILILSSLHLPEAMEPITNNQSKMNKKGTLQT